MNEAFKISEENTKKSKAADKKQWDLKSTFEPLKFTGRVLV